MTTNRRTQSGRGSPSRLRRRGGAYVLVLTSAMLVTMMGLAAASLTRVDLETSRRLTDRGEARALARSAVELAMLELFSNRDWRREITHGGFTGPRELGRGSYRHRITDPVNGDFDTDRNAPVRIEARGEAGDAVWIELVDVQPPLEEIPPALIRNGDFESGTSPWQETPGGDITRREVESPGGNGEDEGEGKEDEQTRVLRVRGDQGEGAMQELDRAMTNSATHHLGAWLRSSGGRTDVVFRLRIDAPGGERLVIIDRVEAGDDWRIVSVGVAPRFDAATAPATLEIVSGEDNGSFEIDEVSFRMTSARLGVLPGTGRRGTQ